MPKTSNRSLPGFIAALACVALASGLELPVRAQNVPLLTLNADTGRIAAPFILKDGVLSQPVTTGLAGGGRAVYTFSLTNSGSCVVEALVRAPATNANSFYISIDTEPDEASGLWEIPVAAGFTNRPVTSRKNRPGFKDPLPVIYKLAAGEHRLIVAGCEANTLLARLSIFEVAKPKPPGSLRLSVSSQ